jgi:predicted N-acetyltransferase YhbS
MLSAIVTRPAASRDLDAILALQAYVFGPGRFARSAYRVREGQPLLSRFCRVADDNGRLIASIRMTEVMIGGTSNATLLGPLAVDPNFRDQGYGRKLVAEAVEEMRASGVALVVLVGDEPYYARFGFKSVPPGQIVFPGPVNPTRILAAELQPGALANFRGLVTAAPATNGQNAPRA